MSERGFITALSIVVGLLSGMAAVVIKNTVWFNTSNCQIVGFERSAQLYLFCFPVVGYFFNSFCGTLYYQKRSEAWYSKCFI